MPRDLLAEKKTPATTGLSSSGPRNLLADSKPETPDRGITGVGKDLAVSAAGGVNAVVKTAGDIYGLASGDMDNPVSRAGESGREYWQGKKSGVLQQLEQNRAEKVASQDGQLRKGGTAFWETMKSPSLLSSFLAEQAPMLLPVGAAGRVAGSVKLGKEMAAQIAKKQAAEVALSAAEKQALKSAGTAATGTAIGTGAAMQGADAGSQAYEQIMGLDDELWQDNQDYQNLIAQGIAPDEAKNTIATGLSRIAAVQSAAASGALNLIPGARVLEKGLAGVKLPGGSRIRNAVTGAIGESLQEGLEEGAGKIAANVATQDIDPSQQTFEGAGEATGLGAAAGPFGAVAGATAPIQDGVADDGKVKTDDVIAATSEGRVIPVRRKPAATEEEGPRALPAPDIVVDSQGQAGTRAQTEQATQDEQRRREELGLDEGVDKLSQQHPGGPRYTPVPRDLLAEGNERIETGPRALPPPVMQGDTRGQVGTQAQMDGIRISLDDLGLTDDVKEALKRHPGKASSQERLAAKESMDQRLPENLKDSRLLRQPFRSGLEQLSQQLVEGGGITLTGGMFTDTEEDPRFQRPVNEQSDVIRTPSQNPPWFQSLALDEGISVKDTKKAIKKALAGKKLGVRQMRVVAGMLDVLSEERTAPENIEYIREEVQKARKLRDEAARGLPPIESYEADAEFAGEIFEEQAYDPDWDGNTRSLSELAREAKQFDLNATEAALDTNRPDGEVARRLYQIIHRGQSNERKQQEGTQAAPRGPEEQLPAETSRTSETGQEVDGQDAAVSEQEATLGAQSGQPSGVPSSTDSQKRDNEPDAGQRQPDEGPATQPQITPQSTEFQSRGTRWRITAKNSEYGDKPPVYTVERETVTDYGGATNTTWDEVRGDEIPKQVALRGNQFLKNVIRAQTGEGDLFGQQNVGAKPQDQGNAPRTPERPVSTEATDNTNNIDDSGAMPSERPANAPSAPSASTDLFGQDTTAEQTRANAERVVDERLGKGREQVPAESVGDLLDPNRSKQMDIADVDAVANEAATSPDNNLPEPSDAQKEAENFKHGHISVQGIDISIENPRGSKRTGKDKDGETWSRTMFSHYGRIKRSEGADGENVDVFVGRNPDSEKAFIIDQIKPDGSFDEHKTMIGYDTIQQARKGYLQNYPKGWDGLGDITEVSIDEFKAWMKDGDTSKPYAQQPTAEKPVVSPDEYHYDEALQAYGHSTMSPRVPAEAHRKDFVESVNSLNSELEEIAETDRQKEVAREQVKKYKEDYLSRDKNVLSARSGVVSSHIAGRSKFNSRQASRRSSSLDRATDRFNDWEKSARKSAIDAVLDARTSEQVSRDTQKRIADAEKKEFNDNIGIIAGNLAAMTEPGMEPSLFRPKATKALKNVLEQDRDEALRLLEVIDKRLSDDGGIQGAVGVRSDFWKIYQEAVNSTAAPDTDAKAVNDALATTPEDLDTAFRELDEYSEASDRWDAMSYEERLDVVKNGWVTKKGNVSKLGERIAKSSFSDLPYNTVDKITKGMPDAKQAATQKKPSEVDEFRSAVKEFTDTVKQATESIKKPAQEAAPEQSVIEKQDADIKRIADGTISVDELKESFYAFLAAEDTAKAELQKMTKDKLLERGGGMLAYRHKSDKKADVIESLYDNLLEEYTVASPSSGMISISGFGNYREQLINAYKEKVESTTEEGIQEYAKRLAVARAERKQQAEEYQKGLENPESLEDYINVIRNHMREDKISFTEARARLTLEQRHTYDKLAAQASREQRKGQKFDRKTEVKTSSQAVDGDIIETQHTKKGHDLFVVQLTERVSREDYNNLNTSAKRLGGYYSKFRGSGAVPGFQFRTRENADAFLQLVRGDTGQAEEMAKARRSAFEDDRSQSSAERLREMADKLEEQADDALNQDRKTNTARRARIAATAESRAEAQKAMADTMKKIAAGIEAGDIEFLDQVRTRSQVEMMNSMLNAAKNEELRDKYDDYGDRLKHQNDPATEETAEFAEWPTYRAWRGDLAKLGRQLQEISGFKLLGNKILKLADDTSKDYEKFAKENIHLVSRFSRSDGSQAVFGTRKAAGEAIIRSGFNGKAIPLQVKRGQHQIVMSPSEAQRQGVWKGAEDKLITLSTDLGVELMEKVSRANRGRLKVDSPWILEAAHDKRKRFKAMGIETPAEFRAAMLEFVKLHTPPKAPDKVKELERSMVGRANDDLDFFPTPVSVAEDMIETADIQDGMTVLEPSAGMGHIADQLREHGIEPDVIEMSSKRRELLEAKGYNVVDNDFLAFKGANSGKELGENLITLITRAKEIQNSTDKLNKLNEAYRKRMESGTTRARTTTYNANASNEAERRDQLRDRMKETVRKFLAEGYSVPAEYIEMSRADYDENGNYSPIEQDAGGGYDRIIMNPPFSDRRDAEHIQHAYNLLNPGGRMVAIAGEGVFFGKDKKAQAFRDWLESVGASDEMLAQGTFQDPSLPVTTGVNARLLVIDKPAAGVNFSQDDIDFEHFYKSDLSPKEYAERILSGEERPERRITDNQAFSRWFGDSKVVDSEGRPLVVELSNAVDSVLSGKPPVPETSVNGLAGNAELISNLLEGETFRTHGLSGFDVPTQRVVLRSVLSFGYDAEILDSVIEFIPVDMVDILRGKNLSPEVLFSNEPVLKKLLTVNSESSISSAVDIANSLIGAVTRVVTERLTDPGFVFPSTFRGARESNSAAEANKGYLSVSSHDHNLLDFKPTGNRGTFDPNDANITHSLSSGTKTSFTVEQAEKAIAKARDAVNKDTGLVVHVIDSKDMPAPVRAGIPAGKKAKGFFYQGEVYLVADALEGAKDARMQFAHEVKGHFGVERILGSQWNEVMTGFDQMQASQDRRDPRLRDKRYQTVMDQLNRRYPNADHVTRVKEFIAIAAEQRVKEGAVGRFMRKVREFLNKVLGRWFKRPFSMTDIDALLSQSEAYLQTGEPVAEESASYEEAMASIADDKPDDDGLQSDYGQSQRNTTAERTRSEQDERQWTSLSGSPVRSDWAKNTRIRTKRGPARIFRGAERPTSVGDFSQQSLGKKTGSPTAGLGVFFTLNPVEAGIYGQAEEFRLDMRNPKYYIREDLPEFDTIEDAYTFREKLRGQGYDGIIIDMRDVGFGYNIVAFSPDDVISVPREPISFSLDEDPAKSGVSSLWGKDLPYISKLKKKIFGDAGNRPPESNDPTSTQSAEIFRHINHRLDPIRYVLQDKFIDLKHLEEDLGVTEEQDAYLAESVWQGRAGEALNTFEEERINPLLEKIADAKVDLAETDRWLHARHAKEANAYLMEINPEREDNEALSGMTDAEADSILNQYKDNAAMQEVGKMIDKINAERVKLLVDEGLLDQATADTWWGTYSHYVPLKREEVRSLLPPRGQGFNIRGKESKQRLGSTRPVTDVVANVIAQYESSVIRSEKNRVGQAFLKFAEANENPALWTVDKPKKTGAISGGEVKYFNDPREYDNELKVKVDGQVHTITFNEHNPVAIRLVRAMKNLDQGQAGYLVRFLMGINRFLSTLNTSWSPEFVISNFARDIQTAFYNMSDTQLANVEKDVIKLVPGALNGLRKNIRGKDKSSEWGQWVERFKKAGGKTGWIDHYGDILQRSHKLSQELERLKSGKDKSAFLKLKAFVEDYNTIVENGIRLSAFRKAVEMGATDLKAAAIAKNLTVNFNRKGMAGPTMNALYLFYNASIQGSVRMLQAMTKSKKGRRLAAATIGAAVMLDILNRALSGDDDDGENIYDSLPDYVKSHYWIVMGDKEPVVKFMLPWGYNVLHVIGQQIGQMVTGDRFDPLEASSRVAVAIAEAFNPVGQGTFLQTVSPTIADPFVEIGENKNWTGAPLKPEQSPFGPAKPEYQQHWSSSREISNQIAEKLNDWSGGDEIRPGRIDVSPEWIDVFVDFFTGSAGRVAADSFNLAQKAVTGQEINVNEVPMVRRAYGFDNSHALQSRYYEWIEDIQYTEKEFKELTGPERNKVRQSPQFKLITIMKVTEKRLRILRKRLRDQKKKGVSKGEIEKTEASIRNAMAGFNRRYAEMMFR